MQAKSDKIEWGFVILTAIAAYFHFQGERLGSQAMTFLGASVVLYYVMRGVLYGRALPKAKAFAASGFVLFAYCAFLAIFILSFLLKVPDIASRLPLLLYAAPIPIVALVYRLMKHDRSEWLPFVVRIAVGAGLVLGLGKWL
ncbi:MAG: hypothetical protein AB8F95_01550 [Bacteroidia bacterium]